MPNSRRNASSTSSLEMTPEPIAFLDSGVGGLPYLADTRRANPGQRYVYVADRENFPYGEKDSAGIIDASIRVTERLIEMRVELDARSPKGLRC